MSNSTILIRYMRTPANCNLHPDKGVLIQKNIGIKNSFIPMKFYRISKQ